MRALLIQAVAYLGIQLLQGMTDPYALQLPFLGWALAQGGVAMLLSWRILAVWWRPIQLGFTPAIVLTQELQLPPEIFLVSFIVMSLLFWSCFRTQVPYFPSSRASHEAVAKLLPEKPFHFLDVGSGFGGMVMDFSRQRPESSFEGVEVAPLPWLVSVIRSHLQQTSAHFQRRDYRTLDLSRFDVIYCYLSPAAMPALWRKARQDMRVGSMLISNEFIIFEAPMPTIIETGSSGRRLYIWRM